MLFRSHPIYLEFSNLIFAGSSVSTYYHGNRTITPNFVLFVRSNDVEIQSMVRHWLTNEKIQVFSTPANSFVYIHRYRVAGNSFYRLVMPAFAAVTESGRYAAWERWRQFRQEYQVERLKGLYYPDLEPRRYWQTVILNLPPPPPRPAKGNLSVYRMPFIVLGAMVIGSAVMFLWEVLHLLIGMGDVVNFLFLVHGYYKLVTITVRGVLRSVVFNLLVYIDTGLMRLHNPFLS